VAERASANGVRLHLDLPLGVHSASFDMWREPDCFVAGVGVGAPRDALCTEGQDWGFAPAHPENQRAQHYRYFIAYVRNQLKHAGILRIDHVMGLHRTFCVPSGMGARAGLYLKQPHDELHAILALEAMRADCVLVGEDLGTVPDSVRESMRDHGMKRTFVMPFELDPGEPEQTAVLKKTALRTVPKAAIASLNTHDMPTFAGLWRAQDIDERLSRGVITATEAVALHTERRGLLMSLLEALNLSESATREDALRTALTVLGQSASDMVVVALEDLWGEVEPQNVPGTFAPDRNFCRRMRHEIGDFARLTSVRALLQSLHQARAASAKLAVAAVR